MLNTMKSWLHRQRPSKTSRPIKQVRPRLHVEVLEDRELPSASVLASSNIFAPNDNAVHSLDGSNASYRLASAHQLQYSSAGNGGPNTNYEVAEFAGYGIYECMNGNWRQLTGANASLLATDSAGDVVGEFAGYGIYEYSNGNWRQLTGANASLLAMDGSGDVVGEFAGYGIYECMNGYWRQLTGANASLLATDSAGDVVGEFAGYGIYEYSNGNWRQLTGANASLLAMDGSGDVVGEFAGYGIYEYSNGNWRQLTGANASLLAMDGSGDVVGEFAGYGIYEYSNGNWRQLTGANASVLAMDASGDVVGEFAGYGIYECTNGNWRQLTGANASLIAANIAPGTNNQNTDTTVNPDPGQGNTYTPVSGSLWGPNGPSYLDVRQGAEGDCWLMASLAEVAARDPSAIESMFTYLGNTTDNGSVVSLYNVRLYDSAGVAHYITVDTELPDGGSYYDNATNGILWAALVEKAYAMANGEGIVTSSERGVDSYAALNEGQPVWALQAITGWSASDFSLNPSDVATAWNAGKLIVLGTSSPASSLIVGGHAYAMVGYNPSSSTPFELYNPWGFENATDYDGQYLVLLVTNAAGLSQNFVSESFGWATTNEMGGINKVSEYFTSMLDANSAARIVSESTGPTKAQTDANSAIQSPSVAGAEDHGLEEVFDIWSSDFGLMSNRNDFVTVS